MKRLIAFTIFLIIAIGGYSQSGISTFKYETRFPSIRVGGATKIKLDSITNNVDTIKFYNGATELVTNGAGIWTGTGVRLDTTLAKVTLGIDQVPNLSLAAMFNDPIFTGVSYFGHSAVPTTPGTGYLGVSDNPWAGLYLGATSPLSWGNSVFLTGGTGQVSLTGGNLSLGSNSLLMTGSLGATASRLTKGWFTDLEVTNPIAGSITGNAATVSSYTPAGGSITLAGADAITLTTTAATSLTLPTSGTVLTTVALAGYAPLEDADFTGDHTTASVFRPLAEGGANLGHPSYGWNAMYLDTTGVVIWGNSDILLGNSGGNLRIENSAFLIDNNDIGLTGSRIRKGWFTDIESTNRPTVGAASVALQQDIADSLTAFLDDATIGVAMADSNIYNGGYATRTYVESLLGSGTGMTTQRLPFIIGTTTGAPSASDSTITHTAFSGKHVNLYRDGALQYQNSAATNTVEGFRLNSSVITVNPVWQSGEQVIIDVTDPALWVSLGLEGEESSILDSLRGYWKLDETSGTIVTDALGVQNGSRTATTGVGVAGILGYANDFYGPADAITIPYNSATTINGADFTVAMWFKLDSLPSLTGREQYLFQTHIGNEHYIYINDEDDKIVARSRNNSGTLYQVTNTSALSDSTWYHIAFVNQGDGETLKIYLNGSDVSTSAGTFTGTLYTQTGVTCFGNQYSGANAALSGILDSPGIWGRALTSGEIAELYNSGIGKTYPFN